MRTTLTLEDDVAVRLEELRRETGESFKELVNRALREGLVQMGKKGPTKRRAFRTRPVSSGRLLVPSLDDVTAVLEWAEGPQFK